MKQKTLRREALHETGEPAKGEAYLAVLYSFSEIEVKVMRIFWTDFFRTTGGKRARICKQRAPHGRMSCTWSPLF